MRILTKLTPTDYGEKQMAVMNYLFSGILILIPCLKRGHISSSDNFLFVFKSFFRNIDTPELTNQQPATSNKILEF
jgi:hypothetical protein